VVFVLLRATVYIYQPYLKGVGFSIAQTGLVYAAVYLVAAMVAHRFDLLRRQIPEATLVWTLLGTLVVTFFLLGTLRGPIVLVVMGIQAAANGLYSPLVKLMMQRQIVESHRRATVLSVESMARRTAFGLFSPVAGGVMSAWGPSVGLLLCGGVGLLALVALSSRERRAVPAAPIAVAPEPSRDL
jgi:hypothetical protein